MAVNKPAPSLIQKLGTLNPEPETKNSSQSTDQQAGVLRISLNKQFRAGDLNCKTSHVTGFVPALFFQGNFTPALKGEDQTKFEIPKAPFRAGGEKDATSNK
jgi:hypothetical protein